MNTEHATTETTKDCYEMTIKPGSNQALAPLNTVKDLLTTRLHLIVENLSPVCHFEGNEGNISMFMRERVYDPERPERQPEDVPYLTGNSMRHSMREACTWITLRMLDMDLHSLSPAAQHVLMSGGALGKDSVTMDVESYRQLTKLFPYVTLFGGGGIGAALVRGNLAVDAAVLMCRQNARRIALQCPQLEEDVGNRPSAQAFTMLRQGTRHDARRHHATRHLLTEESWRQWENERGKSAAENQEDGTESTQMLYSYEAVCAGAQWYWGVMLQHGTPLEHSLLVCGLMALQAAHRLGGKGNTGHGKFRLQCIQADGATKDIIDGLEAASVDDRVERLMERFAGPYAAHVAEHREQIIDVIRGLK